MVARKLRNLLSRGNIFALAALSCGLALSASANAADVSGTVTTATGAPAANVPVVLGSPLGGTASLLKGITNSVGAYTIVGVAPGTYAVAPAKTGTYFNPNARTLSVGTANLINVNFQVAGTDAVRPTVQINTPAAAPGNSYANLASVNGAAVDATSGVLAVGISLSRRESSTSLAAVYNWRENRWDAGATVAGDNIKLATLTAPTAGRVNWSATLPAALAPGTYVLNATATDRALNPSVIAAALFNITTGTPAFSISGRITNSAGAGVAGVPVALASSAAALNSPSPAAIFRRVTDSTGNFSFPGFTPGTYFVAPVRPSSFFTPTFRAVALGRANVANVNFQLAGNDTSRATVTIVTPAAAPNNVYTTLAAASGTAADAESNIVGVGVVLSRRAAGTTPAAVWNWRLNQWSLGVATGPDFVKLATVSPGTNGAANWSVPLPRTALVNGTYQLTATALNRASLLSVPASAVFVIGPPARTFAVSGRVATSAGVGISGVTVTLRLNNSSTTRTALTTSTGAYSFAAVPTGSHIATANKTGTTITPASRTVVVSTANVVNVDFVGATGSTSPIYPGNYTGRVSQTTNQALGGADIRFTVASNGVVTGKVVFDADNSNSEEDLTGNVVLSSGSIRMTGSGTASNGATITLTLTGALRAAGTGVTGSGSALLDTPFGSLTGTWSATKGTTPTPNTAFVGNYTGGFRVTAGNEAGTFGPLTLSVAANGVLRMVTINYYGFELLYTGNLNLTTGALTATRADDNSSATGTLRVNGTSVTGTGTFRYGDGNTGTLTFNKVVNNPFAGSYVGTYTLTAGPNTGGTGTVALTVGTNGFMSLTERDGPRFVGTINTSDGSYILTQVTTTTDPTPSRISGRLSATGTSAASAYTSEDGTRGTVTFRR